MTSRGQSTSTGRVPARVEEKTKVLDMLYYLLLRAGVVIETLVDESKLQLSESDKDVIKRTLSKPSRGKKIVQHRDAASLMKNLTSFINSRATEAKYDQSDETASLMAPHIQKRNQLAEEVSQMLAGEENGRRIMTLHRLVEWRGLEALITDLTITYAKALVVLMGTPRKGQLAQYEDYYYDSQGNEDYDTMGY